jgi:hypothetical protein
MLTTFFFKDYHLMIEMTYQCTYLNLQISMNVLQIHVQMAGHVMILSMDMNVHALLDMMASTVTMVSFSGSLKYLTLIILNFLHNRYLFRLFLLFKKGKDNFNIRKEMIYRNITLILSFSFLNHFIKNGMFSES